MQRANDLLALATLAVLVAGCAAAGQSVEPMSATATASTAPSTVGPSSSPVASPTPSADPGPGGLEVGRIAEIVTTDLVVRSLPEISDASAIDPVRVPIGFLAYIVDGPVAADGYDWYRVAPFPPTLSDVVESHPEFGWLAAAGKDGEPWIAPWDGNLPPAGLGWNDAVSETCRADLLGWSRNHAAGHGAL